MFWVISYLIILSGLLLFLFSKDIRLSDNPVADPGQGGFPRFDLVARLAKVEMLNGSEANLEVPCAPDFLLCLYNNLILSV